MNINISNYKNNIPQSLNFKRKLREDEKPQMEADMEKAFKYLGIKNRALIIHGSVYPESKTGAKNYYTNAPIIRNHNIGSPYNQREFHKTMKMHGFNCVQQGPNGELCKGDNSPYRASIYAKNPLFIDYGALTTDKYANILSKDEINKINIKPTPSNKDYEMSDFNEAKEVTKILMHKSYSNFQTKLAKGDLKAQKLNSEYETFKQQNDWAEKYAVFHILSGIHGTDNFHKWENETDKHIFKLKDNGNIDAKNRYNLIKERSNDEIEEYMFTQFIVDKQEKADKEERTKDGIKVIGDLLVGFSYADELIHENAFLPNWKIGAEYGGPCNSPQIWNNPMPDPNKLFNEDGSLGESGKLLYNKVKRAVENVENVRIDNVMGLVDPYVYKADSVHMITGVQDGKTVSIADRNLLEGGNLSNLKEVDTKDNFKKILHNIIIPVLEDNGINPKEAVWEALGEQSDAFKHVFFEQEKLPGIILPTGAKTEDLCFDWGPVRNKHGEIKKDKHGNEIWRKNVQKPDWSLIGSHDNIPTFKYLNQDWIYQNVGWDASYLGGFLNPDPKKANERIKMVADIEKNPRDRLKAKYAELMRGTQNIQVTFSDVFGIDKVYNPRDNSADTWKLRLSEDYNDQYHQNLVTEDKPVMNMPELVGIAVNAKAGMDIAMGIKSRNEATEEATPILEKMKHWGNILKEPE